MIKKDNLVNPGEIPQPPKAPEIEPRPLPENPKLPEEPPLVIPQEEPDNPLIEMPDISID